MNISSSKSLININIEHLCLKLTQYNTLPFTESLSQIYSYFQTQVFLKEVCVQFYFVSTLFSSVFKSVASYGRKEDEILLTPKCLYQCKRHNLFPSKRKIYGNDPKFITTSCFIIHFLKNGQRNVWEISYKVYFVSYEICSVLQVWTETSDINNTRTEQFCKCCI